MKRIALLFCALVAAAAGVAAPASAAPVTDCPLRDLPFSASSPLVDIMLSPQAMAALSTAAGGSMAQLRSRFGTTAPTFASILTVREGLGMAGRKADNLEQIDAALRRVPVTAADRVARCARYDNDRPRFTLPAGRPRLLLFEKITGFRDGPSVDAAHAAFIAMAERKGWGIVATDKGGAITPAILRNFDAVIWNNISGDVLTLSQRRALRQYIEGGGGFLAVHGSAGDPAYFWDWYVDRLIGARWAGHPRAKQFQDARVVIEDPRHPVASGLPRDWVMNDEWYSFKTNPRAAGARVLATLDESTYQPDIDPGLNLRMGDHPIAWSNCIGRGRMFYSAIGHRPETYSHPNYVTMLESAVNWTTDKAACAAGRRRR